jgi:DNA-binding NarL/FixJ family response regulator
MRVLAVEDHALVLDGLRHLLPELEPELVLVTAITRDETLAVLETQGSELDLVVLDLCLPGAQPFELLRECRRLAPAAPVVVLSATENRLEVERALELGAQAYLFKSVTNDEILSALGRVLAGEVVAPSFGAPRSEEPETLTERQREVLQLLARGVSNKEIAAQLGLAENTVKVHLAQCYRVLGVSTRTAAVRKAVRSGLVRDE